MSNSLWPHGPQHTRLPCPSPTPGVYPNSCPLSRWCHPTISSSVVPFFSCLQSFPASGSFQMRSALRIRWPKYWSFSFSISPSNEHSGLISFRIDWLDLLVVQGTLNSLLQCILQSERSQTEIVTYSMIPITCHSGKGKTMEPIKDISGVRGERRMNRQSTVVFRAIILLYICQKPQKIQNYEWMLVWSHYGGQYGASLQN